MGSDDNYQAFPVVILEIVPFNAPFINNNRVGGVKTPPYEITILRAEALPGFTQESRTAYTPGAPVSAGTARQISICHIHLLYHKGYR